MRDACSPRTTRRTFIGGSYPILGHCGPRRDQTTFKPSHADPRESRRCRLLDQEGSQSGICRAVARLRASVRTRDKLPWSMTLMREPSSSTKFTS
jgi:hypothetical protein